MTAAVVLAAGGSERMGRSKADLPLPGGATFLEAILATLARLRIAPVVVVAEGAPAPRALATVVVNPDPSRGMLSSVQCGLRALPEDADAVLLWPVDHPRVEPGTIATLLAAHRAHRAAVVVPVQGGRRGHPILVAEEALSALAELPPTGNAGELVRAREDRLEVDVTDAAIHDDIDTLADYERVFGRPL